MQYSQRIDNLGSSPIRDILAVVDRPGMVSFAGGLPSDEAFPRLMNHDVPRENLQYGPSEGEPVLRELVADMLQSQGLACEPSQVLILNGSQQGIDLTTKLFVDSGSRVAVESPTYLAALQVFRFFGADMHYFDVEEIATLPTAVSKSRLVYTIPNFQNPTGRCYDAAQRNALAEACDRNNTPLFEDDPYRDLNYDGLDTQPVSALLRRAPWVYQGSFSKSLAPGLRLGYLACSESLQHYLVQLKQAADLHSNRISQAIVARTLMSPGNPARIAALVDSYRNKRDRFAAALRRHFSDLATWQIPPGGLFFWLTLKSHKAIDTRRLLPLAIARNVAFMPGEPFYADRPTAANALRLNFSHASEDDMNIGLATLAELVEQAVSE